MMAISFVHSVEHEETQITNNDKSLFKLGTVEIKDHSFQLL